MALPKEFLNGDRKSHGTIAAGSDEKGIDVVGGNLERRSLENDDLDVPVQLTLKTSLLVLTCTAAMVLNVSFHTFSLRV